MKQLAMTAYGVWLGDEVEDRLSGIKGKVTAIMRFLAGCEYVSIEYNHKSGKESSHFCSSHLVSCINSDDRDKYLLVFEQLNSKDTLNNIPRLGSKIKNIDGEELILVGVDVSFRDQVSYLCVPKKEVKDGGFLYPEPKLVHPCELTVIDDGIAEFVESNIKKRCAGELYIPKVGDLVRSETNGHEAVVVAVDRDISGTIQVSLPVEAYGNHFSRQDCYDVEFLTILKKA